MNLQKIKSNRGFVILIAVTLSSIILAISLGVTNVVLKEVKFGTSVRNSNDAFLAADTGAECALFHDKSVGSFFPIAGPATPISCAAITTTPGLSLTTNTASYNFIISGLGNSGVSCVKVVVFKDGAISPPFIRTTVTSKGYNIGDASCISSNLDRIEREIITTY